MGCFFIPAWQYRFIKSFNKTVLHFGRWLYYNVTKSKESWYTAMNQKITGIEIRRKNRSCIFDLFRQGDPLSRQDIAAVLDLSLPTVTHNLEELKSEGLITHAGFVGNTGGRRARTYSLVASARTAIGLDITRHHVTAVALDLRGAVIASRRRRLDFARTDAYYRELGAMVQQIVSAAELDTRGILGVGIGIPGLITADHRQIFYGEVLGATGATCAEFSKYIPYPTSLYHDTDAACFAEMWANPDTQNVFYIMLSASVGGAVCIGGTQYTGSNARAGEVGHMLAVPNGRKCYCGRRGCVDSYCAAPALTAATGGDLKLFFHRLQEGDREINAIWQEYLAHLAVTVSNLRMLFDCNIIIGGYVGSYIDPYLPQLRELLMQHSTFDDNADYVQSCRCKTEAIAVGAALHDVAKFLESI